MKKKPLFFILTYIILAVSLTASEPSETFVDEIHDALECPYVYQSVNVITGDYCENQTDLQLSGTYSISLKRCYSSEDPIAQGWHFNHPNIPTSLCDYPEDLNEGENPYTFDEEGRLKQVRAQQGGIIFHTLDFTYCEDDNGHTICSVESDDGNFAQYTFSKIEPSRSVHPYLLQEVSTSKGKQISYIYRDHPRERRKIISRREEPLGRYLLTEYYDSFINDVGGTIVKLTDPNRDPRIGKVKLQRAPVGVDETPIITSRFFYNQGNTEVYDVLNNKTVYWYGKNNKLTAIENYLEDESLYRIERFFWNKTDQLISRTIENAQRAVHCCQTFEYDIYGNMVKQSIFGNLTGNNEQSIIIDKNGQPQDNGVECFTTLYRYSDDNKHLLLFQTADNSVTTRYFYDEDSDRISCKLTYNKDALRIRQFFEYDDLGNLTANIVDDGVSEDLEDLTLVTERRISRFYPKYDAPGRGFPEIVEEKYLDLSNGLEVLLKRTVLTYSPKSEVISQDIFDALDNYQYSLTFDYDDYGRLIESTDAEGNTKRISYDDHGNKVHVSGRGNTVVNTYNFSNRLIRTENSKEDGSLEITSFRYDYAGNRSATIDSFGNETTYEYDALGRLSKTIYPLVADSDNNGVNPTITKVYDIMDRVVSAVDPNGHTTKTKYNARGKPTVVIHSDGSMEKYEYNLDGTLRRMASRNGSYTIYDRDFLSRVTSEKRYGANDALISSTVSEYSAFHLIAESDQSGKTTFYEYDGAGRQTGTIQESITGTKYTTISYDSKGQVVSRKEWYGTRSDECIIASVERDDKNTIIAFCIQNAFGEVLKKSNFNPEDPSQEKPQFTYNYDHYNQFGQNVLQTFLTDENGTSAITTHDAIGRPVQIEKKNILGQMIQCKEMCYDAAGNKTKEVHHILGTTTHSKQPYICLWNYGPENRLESSIEGYGSEKSRKTLYSYSNDGSLESVTKPDGTALHYQYSTTGAPLSLKSSDGTIDYTFGYDHLDRLIEIQDNINNTTTEREYNDDNLLTFEKLGNGLTLTSHYDFCGRRTELTLPDDSQVLYNYDAAYLRTVERTSANGNVLYTHTYRDYSLSGRVLEEGLIADLGTLTRTYDKDNFLQSIESKHWAQKIQRNEANQISLVTTEDPSGLHTTTFEYDEKQQLTIESSLDDRAYSYDSTNNRTEVDDKEVCFNEIGQLLTQGEKRYTYDLNGNLIAINDAEETTSFEYDALNRLIKVNKGHNLCITYLYDSFNRRLSSTKQLWSAFHSQWETDETKHYIYDGTNEIGAANERYIIQQLRILGVGLGAEIGAAIAIEIENKTYAPIHDHRGSVCCLIDIETGNPAEWNRYSAFGIEETHLPYAEKIGNPWKFSSKRQDAETGLVFFGQRYYLPEIGRWLTKDPLGTPESINRYAYNLNDPINRIDPQGLFSFTDIWNNIWENLQSAYNFTIRTINTFINHVSFTDYIRPTADKIGQFVFGKMFLQLSGFYKDASETGVHGKGEIADNVRITLINGILNCRADFKQTLDLVSEVHGGANVHYIFDATDGWCWDILKCFLVKCGYISPQANMIANTWKKMIEEMGGVKGGGKIYHYAHSIGGTHTKSALRLMSPEEKNMIRIFTFGSPSSINDDLLDGVFNYVSVRDGVCLLDPIGFFSGLFGFNENIIPVGDWLGVPFIDHMLYEGTYVDIIKLLGHHFLQIYITGQGY